MNIIALLESISLDKSKIGNYSREEFTQIKKQLIAEKGTNQEIQDSDIAKLLKALKSDPESFQAVLNNRILFNFFAKKEYPRQNFSDAFAFVETEKVKSFIQLFLSEELAMFFNQNLELDKFNEIGHLAAAVKYFPDSLDFALHQHALDKLDNAIAILKPPYGNMFTILYIKDGHFFTFFKSYKKSGD